MRLLTVVVLLVGAALAVFSFLNWGRIVEPGPLSLGFTTVHAPLGLVLLGATVLLTVAFLALFAYEQAHALVEARRAAKDLRAQRELADQAEHSRFMELRAFVKAEVDAATNGLAAHLAEIEDKLDRALEEPRR